MGWRPTLAGTSAISQRRAKGIRGAVDRVLVFTRYGTKRISTKSYFTHHTQQISKAAVMYDARAIFKRVTVLLHSRCERGRTRFRL